MVFECDLAKKILAKYNCTDVEAYSLVSNSGVVFTLNGIRYDARHWRNVYGVDVDYWKVMKLTNDITADDETLSIITQIETDLNNMDSNAI